MENDVRILKMVDGKDVICFLEKISVIEYKLYAPMLVAVKYNGPASSIILKNWLPIEVVEYNDISVNATMVVGIYRPNKSLSEYYVNSAKDLQRSLDQKSKLNEMEDPEEMMDILRAMEEFEEETLH
jgi:hypothetical protein